MPIENCDYFIHVMSFPVSIPAFLRMNSDGTYCIFVNADMSYDQQQAGIQHELNHIINDDLYSGKDILDIEPQLR